MKLQGRTAVVTGGAKGIGRAISERFAAEGAYVVVSDIDEVALGAVVTGITDAGGRADGYLCDVTDRGRVGELIAFAVAHGRGRLDILVNNAGGAIVAGKSALLHETTEDNVRRMLDVNLMGVIWATQAAVPLMIAQGYGRIISMSSVSGMNGGTPAMYATAKSAIIGLTKSVAVETAVHGVTVNCLAPWAIATREGPAKLPTRVGRKGSAEEVAALALFLASDEAGFITGSNYVIDGGWNSGN